MSKNVNPRILLVDDDENILTSAARNLKSHFEIFTAESGAQGLEILDSKGPFAVVISDMRMPIMDGTKFLTEVKQNNPETIRILLTGYTDIEAAIAAINDGQIFRFITKPCSPDMLINNINDAVKQYKLVVAKRQLEEGTVQGIAQVLMDVTAITTPKLINNLKPIQAQVKLLSKLLGISESWQLETAIMLCRIGYIAIPPSIAFKKQEGHKLSPEEIDVITKIPEIGSNLLAKIPRLEYISKIILYQNKNVDGSGFPNDDISGERIPLGARILKILLDISDANIKGDNFKNIFPKMYKENGKYDIKVLKIIEWFFSHVEGNEYNSNAFVPRIENLGKVKLDALQDGDKLKVDVVTIDDIVLCKQGETVSRVTLEKIKIYSDLIDLTQEVEIERERRKFLRIPVNNEKLSLKVKLKSGPWNKAVLKDISGHGIQIKIDSKNKLQLPVGSELQLDLQLNGIEVKTKGIVYCQKGEWYRMVFSDFKNGLELEPSANFIRILNILENDWIKNIGISEGKN